MEGEEPDVLEGYRNEIKLRNKWRSNCHIVRDTCIWNGEKNIFIRINMHIFYSWSIKYSFQYCELLSLAVPVLCLGSQCSPTSLAPREFPGNLGVGWGWDAGGGISLLCLRSTGSSCQILAAARMWFQAERSCSRRSWHPFLSSACSSLLGADKFLPFCSWLPSNNVATDSLTKFLSIWKL